MTAGAQAIREDGRGYPNTLLNNNTNPHTRSGKPKGSSKNVEARIILLIIVISCIMIGSIVIIPEYCSETVRKLFGKCL
jgi:hypothetical protein